MNDFLLSIVIPVFNEKNNILPLLDALLPILENYSHEVLFVNDGSRDGTAEIITEIAQKNHNIKLVSFNRNFGHQIALMAGYSFSKGDAIISMDADLQDPPTVIPHMIEKWQKGAKIVYAKRKKRDVDSFFKKKTAEVFYRFMNMLSDIKIPENVGDFRLLDRSAVKYLTSLPEHAPFLRGLVAWGGYTEDFVYFDREERHSGKTHYSVSKMINFALDGITSFSVKPLRLATYMGFTAGSFGFLGIIYAVIGKFFLPIPWVTGWTGIFVGIMFIGGVQLITIGIIGEYISKIYLEVLQRPHYLLKEKINID
ncbi:MAG: glycosyltransferase family 2 protein [Candidatus Roizmanbacteria bacterium]|nr:glycosyltransferase family 2 protein [Candidatus Roizmanbacteria bacterium]